jgi:hypothetical protein
VFIKQRSTRESIAEEKEEISAAAATAAAESAAAGAAAAASTAAAAVSASDAAAVTVSSKAATLPSHGTDHKRPIWSRAGHKVSKRCRTAGMRFVMSVKSCFATPAAE